MKIYQILSELNYGDAVGNDVRALGDVISEMGYDTGIYAVKTDKRLSSPMYRKFSQLPKLADDDVIILHHCCGSDLTYKLPKLSGRKMMIYHNITPPEFFLPYNKGAYENAAEGYRQTKELSKCIEYVMADSKYNTQDLKEMGYTCPMFVRPILIPFDDYKKEPDGAVIEKYTDEYTNIIFVGRIAPNKKHEDIIQTFAYYKKHINPKSRLIFVGSDRGFENYSSALSRYIEALGVEDIVFTGHIKFSEILAYYKIADVFLCMSEHEGFCVPLVEAMFFEVPIIAYASSAIPDTLGGSGVLLKEKDPVLTAMLIDRIVKDKALRESLIKKQNGRLKDFSYESIKGVFKEGLNKFINAE